MKTVCLVVFLAAVLWSCTGRVGQKEGTLADISDTKVLQYAIEGKILYETHCANCHQKDGVGLGKLIPPIKQADYFLEDPARTARIIKYGQKGPIIVNGIPYDEIMPANPKLTDMEIAQLMTYLYNVWGAKEGLFEPRRVREFLEKAE